MENRTDSLQSFVLQLTEAADLPNSLSDLHFSQASVNTISRLLQISNDSKSSPSRLLIIATNATSRTRRCLH